MQRFDVAIIGGGLIGTASSFYLAGQGSKVVVIEREQINSGASGRNAGSLHFQLEPRMADGLRQSPDDLAKIVPISIQAIEDWRGLSKALDCDLEVSFHGGLMITETQADVELLEKKVKIENRVGLRTKVIDRSEIDHIAPYLSNKVIVAGFCEQEGHANPRLVTPAFARESVKRGVQYRLNTAVTGVRRQLDRWRIDVVTRRSQQGRENEGGELSEVIEANAVLIAAGAWSTQVLKSLGVTLPLSPLALTMNVTEATRPLIPHLIQHMGRRLSLKQTNSGNILVGGGWPSKLFWTDSMRETTRAQLMHETIIGNLRVGMDVVPQLARLHLIRSWSGIASDTSDHLPLLGSVAGLPNVYLAAGGSGFTLGPTFARLISDLIATGVTEMDISPFDPNRFRVQ